MGCLLAEFKLTAMPYGQGGRGRLLFGLLPFALHLTLCISLSLSFLPLSFSLFRNLAGEILRGGGGGVWNPGGQLTHGSLQTSRGNLLSQIYALRGRK